MASADTNLAISLALETHLNRLRQLNTQDIQSRWHQSTENLDLSDVLASNSQQWPLARLNNRQHIAWNKGCQLLWLCQTITVPTHFHGYPLAGLILRIGLTWWADAAEIYVDGSLVQSGDLFECFTRICLSPQVTPGQTFQVAIRLVSPVHDDGALVRSQLFYECSPNQPTPEPSFIADELTVLATLEPASQAHIQTGLNQLDWRSLSKKVEAADSRTHPFQTSLTQLRETLIPLTPPLKQRQIQCVGHAHLDMAWLWPIADTWNAAERTFQSVLNLQQDFPDLTYTHSSPALFEWLEHNQPELFQQIQQKVAEGSWSIDAGLWIEPEFNLISGEAIARHILYGQRYCQAKFGSLSKIAWLPDSFGFCWQLPQLLSQGGIETFATLKLSWNDTTQFPHQLFWWQSPDGSRILSLMLPPIGSDIDPIKMSVHANTWAKTTGITNSLWLPGLGDHGGGPTRDMLEKARRWQDSPFFPTLKFTSPNSFISDLPHFPTSLLPHSSLPIWNNELYLELHRGCYTTHADQKQHNRRCEDLLYQAEVFATIAQLTANQPYPKANIDTAWKKLLFNQFHDILPGTSIPEVFIEVNRDWQKVKEIGHRILDESIGAIASAITLPPPPFPNAQPVLVFNPLSWSRSSLITLKIPDIEPNIAPLSWAIYDEKQQLIPCQISPTIKEEQPFYEISFQAKLPAVGYQCYWMGISDRPNSHPNTPPQFVENFTENYILENDFLKASIDSKTGHITHLIEKTTQTETFSAPGNQLQAFQDQGQYWDAWNIDPNYAKHLLPKPTLRSIQWIEKGSLHQRLRVRYQFQQSTIEHHYSLEKGTPFLKVETAIDWKETQILLKANFPLTVSSDIATYEIPFGAITRATNPKTAAEEAQWEVPALRWADLGNQAFGVSILTNCKHGFDASANHLRLTLLKSPIWPDPNADRHLHHFTYAIYPHPGTWQTAQTTRHARELNIAPIIYQPSSQLPTSHTVKSSHSFLTINNPNLILSALKPSEDNNNEFILRCYETHGETTNVDITTTLTLDVSEDIKRDRVNLLETPLSSDKPALVTPWQIASYRIRQFNSKTSHRKRSHS